MSTTPAVLDFFELLERMLTGDPLDRIQAHGEISPLHAGLTIVDNACSQDGKPYLLTFSQLHQHLRKTDSDRQVKARGHRLHTPENTSFGSAEDEDGYGPAAAFGAYR